MNLHRDRSLQAFSPCDPLHLRDRHADPQFQSASQLSTILIISSITGAITLVQSTTIRPPSADRTSAQSCLSSLPIVPSIFSLAKFQSPSARLLGGHAPARGLCSACHCLHRYYHWSRIPRHWACNVDRVTHGEILSTDHKLQKAETQLM